MARTKKRLLEPESTEAAAPKPGHWRKDKEREALERLATLLVREIDRILFDLDFRKDLLFRAWSRHRTRTPLLQTLRSHYYELTFRELGKFPPDTYRLLDNFYRLLDAFIFYVTQTEDMPTSLALKFDSFLGDLKRHAQPALTCLKEFCGEDDLKLEIPVFGD